MQTQDQSNVGGSDSAALWFPNSSLGTNLATKTPFCFPFVLPVISDETEFQEAKHSQTEFENERKSARGLAHSKTLRELRGPLRTWRQFWSAVPQLQARTPKAGATLEASLVIRELLGVRQTSGAFSLVPTSVLGMFRPLKLCFIGNDGQDEGKTKRNFRRQVGSQTGVWEPGDCRIRAAYV